MHVCGSAETIYLCCCLKNSIYCVITTQKGEKHCSLSVAAEITDFGKVSFLVKPGAVP